MDAQRLYSLAQARGVNAFATVCQSALETGYWNSRLWEDAKNGAGIKAPAAWVRAGKPVCRVVSREFSGGQWTERESVFRAYPSAEGFLADYAAKIRSDYPYSWESADNWPGYFAGLYRGRWGAWATDPEYFGKLLKMAVKFAPELLGAGWQGRMRLAFSLALDRGSLEMWQRGMVANALKEVGA